METTIAAVNTAMSTITRWLVRCQRRIAFLVMRRADRRLVINALSSGHNFANLADRLGAVSLRKDMEQ